MSEPTPLLGREGIEEAFRRLGDRLAIVLSLVTNQPKIHIERQM